MNADEFSGKKETAVFTECFLLDELVKWKR
jgi:hypothetical protein